MFHSTDEDDRVRLHYDDLTERSLHPISRGLIATSTGHPSSTMTARATYRAGQRDGRGSQFGGSGMQVDHALDLVI